jgi:hypothetical protein
MNNHLNLATLVLTPIIAASLIAVGSIGPLDTIIEAIAEVKISQNIEQNIEQRGSCGPGGESDSIINNRASNSIVNSFNSDVDQRTTVVDSSSACSSTMNTCMNGECQTTTCKNGECKTTKSISE